MKKFNNIEDYYSFLDQNKSKSSDNDPYGEEDWGDDIVDFEIDLNPDLDSFLLFMETRIKKFFDSFNDISIHGNLIMDFPSDRVIKQLLINKNKKIISNFKEIIDYLNDNFYYRKTKLGFEISPKRGSSFLEEYKDASFLRLSRKKYSTSFLGDIINDKFNLDIDVENEEEPYVIEGFDVAIYWSNTHLGFWVGKLEESNSEDYYHEFVHPESPGDLHVDDEVVHSKYGSGVILKKDKTYVTIKFDDQACESVFRIDVLLYSRALKLMTQKKSEISWWKDGKLEESQINELLLNIDYKFKIGDRVRANQYLEIIKKGDEGTVIAIGNYADRSVCVEFDKKRYGYHDGQGRGEKGHCWWTNIDYLDLIEEEPNDVSWWKDGKLEEAWIPEDSYNDKNYNKRFKVGDVCFYIGNKSDYQGEICEILDVKKFIHVNEYYVIFSDGYKCWTTDSFLSPSKNIWKEKEEELEDISWWKDGKLEEGQGISMIRDDDRIRFEPGDICIYRGTYFPSSEVKIVTDNGGTCLVKFKDGSKKRVWNYLLKKKGDTEEDVSWWKDGKLEESIDNKFEVGDICEYLGGFHGRKHREECKIINISVSPSHGSGNFLITVRFSDGQIITTNKYMLTKKKGGTMKNDDIQWWENGKLKESYDPLSGTTDVKVTVKGDHGLSKRLIDNLSLIVQKRTSKSLRIKAINGYFNKEIFAHHDLYMESYLEIDMINKDFIVGEYKSITHSILIKINDEIVYDMISRNFDNEVLIEKIVSEYKKYLTTRRFTINDK